MRRTTPLAMVALAAITMSLATQARATAPPRLAVLYFDNNTAEKKLDVLQKGLADMFITDLASVRGIVVVERDKLQSILKELRLQRSRYFNKRTAVKIGKQLGATHVVSGNFAVAGEKIRIGARLIKVRSGRVLLGTKVVGAKTSIFELEQRLVAQFVEGLRKASKPASASPAPAPRRAIRAYRPRRRGRTQIPNIATLVDYSKGLDLVDKGQFRAAALRLAAVAVKAPTFRLAKQRQRDLERRLKRAGARRQVALSDQTKGLLAKARAFVKRHKPDAKDRNLAKTWLAYRCLLNWFQIRTLRGFLAPKSPHLIKPGKRGAALAQVRRYVKGQLQLLKSIARYAKRHTRVYPNGVRHLDRFVRFPNDDSQVLRESGITSSPSIGAARVSMDLARFLLLGTTTDGTRKGRISLAPVPSSLVPGYEKMGIKLLKKIVQEQDKKAKRKVAMAETLAIRARTLWGEALLLRGKRDDAVSKWQEVLDRYPTSRSYKFVEARIKKQLGLKHDFYTKRLQRYLGGLKSCKDMELRVGIGIIMGRRIRLMGFKGVEATLKEVEKACRAKSQSGQAKLKYWWKYLYQTAALKAGRAGHCKRFDKWIQRAVAEGLSPRSASGYRRNYTSCP